MHREQIREQFSLLEEQLERLMVLSAPSISKKEHELDVGEEDLLLGRVKSVFDELQELVREETLRQKSIDATDFAQKLIKILIAEASAKKMEIAITYCASGRISMEMVEVSMGAILSCIKASLKSYSGIDTKARIEKNLFPTFSLYLEVHGHSDEIHFRVIDDGGGYESREIPEPEVERHFEKIRGGLAKCGGWFSRVSLKKYGGKIEFKIPLPRNRPEVIVLKKGNFEVLVPCFCVVESTSDVKKLFENKNNLIGILDENHGVIPCKSPADADGMIAIRVGVADFEAWIICESKSERIKSRKFNALDFLEPDSWFQNLGLCQMNGTGVALPLIDGDALMKFYMESEKNEGN